jgi:hypothetical protein
MPDYLPKIFRGAVYLQNIKFYNFLENIFLKNKILKFFNNIFFIIIIIKPFDYLTKIYLFKIFFKINKIIYYFFFGFYIINYY